MLKKEFKRCKACFHMQPAANFYLTREGYLFAWCMSCKRKYNNAIHEKHRREKGILPRKFKPK